MNLLTDEHVPPSVANALHSEGVDAVPIFDTDVAGKNDPAVLRFASEHEAALLTNDRDFVVRAFVDEIDHYGVFFYEDQRTSRSHIVRSVHNALSALRPTDRQDEIVYVPDGWL